MADRRVECANVSKKGPPREGITHLGGAWGTSTKADIISDIEKHTQTGGSQGHTYHTLVGGKKAIVEVRKGAKEELVATDPDDTTKNNLLSLKDC